MKALSSVANQTFLVFFETHCIECPKSLIYITVFQVFIQISKEMRENANM